MRPCTGCYSACYCSEQCQREHWRLEHRAECRLAGDRPAEHYIVYYGMFRLLVDQEKIQSMISNLRRGLIVDAGTPGTSRLSFRRTRNGQLITKNFSVGLDLKTGKPQWDVRASRDAALSGGIEHEIVVVYNDNGEEARVYRAIDKIHPDLFKW